MTKETENWRDSPIAWFACLDRALREEDFDLAGESQRQLNRLGVSVSFKQKKPASVSRHFAEQLKSLYAAMTRFKKRNESKN